MQTALVPAVPTEIAEIETRVKELTINTQDALQAASELMVRIRKTRKGAEDALKQELKPLKEEIKQRQDQANVGLTLLQNAEGTLQRGILEYQRKAREEAEKQQRKALEQYEKKVAKAEAKAEETGAPVPVIALPPVITAPSKSIATEAGKLNTMKVKKWRINGVADPSTLTRDSAEAKPIPDKFFDLNTAAITKVIKAGGDVPGVTAYEEEVLSVR